MGKIKTKYCNVYCKETDRYYVSETTMLAALKHRETISGIKSAKGRKIRNLVNGRFYSSKNFMRHGKRLEKSQSQKMKRNLTKDPDFIKKWSAKVNTKQNKKYISDGLKKYYTTRIGKMRAQMYTKTSKEKPAGHASKIATHIFGVRVKNIIKCKRERTYGVSIKHEE